MPARSAARIVTVHDLDFLDAPERTRAEIRRDYSALAASHARRADRVIANSRTTAHDVQQRLGVPESRITVCYPGAPDWTPRVKEPQAGYLLFLGALEPRKNIAVLLDAYEMLMARLPAAPRLVLAGHARPEAGPWLARLQSAPLAGRGTHLGYVPDAEQERLYAGARALVLPSLDEGFGLPVLAAMSAGVPVIASRRGALPEVVGDGVIEPVRLETTGSLLGCGWSGEHGQRQHDAP
jgi:alpha-1,3-rhamnosyl/mannosyltransferase